MNSKKIATNTILLYIRMLVVLLINLYTVRIVLNALGVEDYGIYNVVAGVITMLTSFAGVLSTATQRFYSYSLGNNECEKLQKIFSASINIYIAISIAAFIIGETFGLWFLNTQLVVPHDRLVAANYIYQFSLLSFVAAIMSTPYSAASIAHEDMGLFAIVSTTDAVLKLASSFSIQYVYFDSLIYYGLTLLLVQGVSFLVYFVVCRYRYNECHYIKVRDRKLHKELLSFSGWTLFSSLAAVGMNQIITFLINIFFGPIVNAARAIAIQVNSAMSTFSNSFIMAIKPPMIKAYAEQNYKSLDVIFNASNKITYYCMLMISILLILEMDTILTIWLGPVSTQTLVFCQLIIVYSVILSLCNPITIIVQATGEMRKYTVPVESVTILTPVVVYIIFKLGFDAKYSFYSMIIMAALAHIVRLICLKKVFSYFSFRKYFIEFIGPAIAITSFSFLFSYFVHSLFFNQSILRFISVGFSSVFTVFVGVLILGLNKKERHALVSFIKK